MKQIFKNLGLSEKEIKIFFTLLELGAQPPSVLARHSGLPRSSIYYTLELLEKLGFIKQFQRSGIKYVQSIAPEEILFNLKRKESVLHDNVQAFQNKLPEIKAIQNRSSITPKVNFYEGKEAVAKMYYQVLQEKHLMTYFNPQLVKQAMPDYHYQIPDTIRERCIEAREILVDCEEAHFYKQKYSSRFHQIKILPTTEIFESDTIITSEKLYMISYGEKDVTGTEIFSKALAETQKMIFERVWRSID